MAKTTRTLSVKEARKEIKKAKSLYFVVTAEINIPKPKAKKAVKMINIGIQSKLKVK